MTTNKRPSEMTPNEAWGIISSNLMELYKLRKRIGYKGYTDADLTAEVICYWALKHEQDKIDQTKRKEKE